MQGRAFVEVVSALAANTNLPSEFYGRAAAASPTDSQSKKIKNKAKLVTKTRVSHEFLSPFFTGTFGNEPKNKGINQYPE